MPEHPEVKPRTSIGIKITEEEFQILKLHFKHTPTLWDMQQLINEAWKEKIEQLKNT